MELEERYKAIFAYLRRCECDYLVNQDVAAKLKEFIDMEDEVHEILPSQYQNKLKRLKDYHEVMLKEIQREEK